MCGISGFNWSDESKIKMMNHSMLNRGPDSQGFFCDENISLGHCRLAIIDLTEAGNQPMISSDTNYIIVYNGEIYNYKEIRKELQSLGKIFQSDTDTEVVLSAFQVWGPNCVEKFIGMFAFSIYDKKKKKLFIFRDHMGIKPLYYYHDNERFIFGSTINSILEHNIRVSPNKKMIKDFLLYNITDHTSETFFTNIKRFEKGHYAEYDLLNHKISFKKWWKHSFTMDYNGTSSEAAATLSELLKKSVKRRLMSDVPVGICLSGGIDSSSIACLLNREDIQDINSFSYVSPGAPLDESKYIDHITKKTGIKNYKTSPTAEDISNDLLDFIKSIEEPVKTPSPFIQNYVYKLAKKNNVTVLLDGQGADELFAGYEYFYGFYFHGLLIQRKWKRAFTELNYFILRNMSWYRCKAILFIFLPKLIKKIILVSRSNISNELLNNNEADTNYFDKYWSVANLKDALQFHIDYRLESLLKWEDKNSMAYSRESRVPFLDADVVKFVFSLPEEYMISYGCTKSVLREAMDKIVPDKILKRVDKIAFSPPMENWLRSKPISKLIMNWFINSAPLSSSFIDLEKTRNIIKKYNKGNDKDCELIWKTIFLEAWLKVYEDRIVWMK